MNDYITFKLFFLINKIDFKRKITGERGGEGEMYGKSNMETYITICKITKGNLLYGSGINQSNRASVSA